MLKFVKMLGSKLIEMWVNKGQHFGLKVKIGHNVRFFKVFFIMGLFNLSFTLFQGLTWIIQLNDFLICIYS